MPGISPEVSCHKLAIDKAVRPVAQKKRNLGEEKKQAALEETKKLLNADFDAPRRPKQNSFYNRTWKFLLQGNAFWLKECRGDISKINGKVFQQQIGRNIEVYVDDMVAKTPAQGSHCDDLVEVFNQLRAYNMRLNPDKCAFGVQGGKFLGFILTSRGIKANPEKCNAVLSMTSPKIVKEVQQIAGRIAALSRFLPAVANRSYHFFQTFSKGKKFTWTDECENSFTELKQLLASPPILQRPEADQPLRQILTRPELAERLIKWSIELSEFDIQYESRKALKSQILADFVSEMTNEAQHTSANWSIHVDEASNREGSGAGVLLKEGEKVIAEQSLQFCFNASNNQAEYEALLAGLKLAQQLRILQITVYCDSLLVVQQIKGEYQVKDPLLEKYWLITNDLISKFSKFDIIHVN
ncbi:uncharacterized protein [Arachis hypogaea]|uniref:uncharacterized protein n=1 Tax=Arachis hypogaea TaxID=3818 RepID=UPI003B2186D9